MTSRRTFAPKMARLLALAALLISHQALAESVSIFDMRKSLPLDPEETATREFYVNAGPEAGLRAGMFVRVTRSIPVHDPIGNKAQANMTVPVGFVKVIHSERGISVARPAMEFTDDERPTLEYEGIMIGDRLDLGSASMDEPKAKKRSSRRLSSAANEAAEALRAAAAAVESAPTAATAPAAPVAQPTVSIPVPAPATPPAAAAAPAPAAPAASNAAPAQSPSASNAPPAAAPAPTASSAPAAAPAAQAAQPTQASALPSSPSPAPVAVNASGAAGSALPAAASAAGAAAADAQKL